MHDIVVTGLGCISAAGHNIHEFSQQLFQSAQRYQPLFKPVSLFQSSMLDVPIAAEVSNYHAEQHFSQAQLNQYDRFTQFALLASQQAIDDAKLIIEPQHSQRIGVVFGTGIGGQTTLEHAYQQLYLHQKNRVHPFTVPKLIPSAAASQISIRFGITGPSFCTSSACSSSGHAIAMASMMLRTGMLDVAVVGGAEACITDGNFLAWQGLRVMAKDSCRPFSAKRNGLVIGEGAGCMILETAAHAKRRNASTYANLIGIGMSADAHNIVQPLIDGAKNAMQAALLDAGCAASQVDYINSHGSGTVQNDITECQAIREVFQAHAQQLPMSSTKSLHGHMLGAGSVIEGIATILSMQQQMVPPTRNFITADPNCSLDCVPNQPKPANINCAMSNSFAFGGLNTTLIFQR